MTPADLTYEIVLDTSSPDSDFHGTASSNGWTNDIGESNVFDSAEDARDGIEQLRTLDEGWADSTFAVRIVGERVPL